MPVTINGTTGIAGVDGSAGTPAVQGADTNTGVFFPAADTVAIATGGSERLRADSSGNVGIGTSSPTARLTVVTAGTNQGEIRVSDNATYYGAFARVQATDEVRLGSYGASQNLTFYTVSSERARIDSSGSFGVGMTGPSGYGRVGVRFEPSGGSHNQTGIGIETSLSTSGARFMQFYNEGGSGIGSITRNSTTNAVLYNTSSDYRLKEQIQPLSGALARVSQMRPVQWVWKDCAGATGEGFVAHELQQVVPGAVSGEKDAVDENGKPLYQGMDASYLVATLTAAIQEQQALITDLTARIAALEAA